jgi:hypothetical protein
MTRIPMSSRRSAPDAVSTQPDLPPPGQMQARVEARALAPGGAGIAQALVVRGLALAGAAGGVERGSAQRPYRR